MLLEILAARAIANATPQFDETATVTPPAIQRVVKMNATDPAPHRGSGRRNLGDAKK